MRQLLTKPLCYKSHEKDVQMVSFSCRRLVSLVVYLIIINLPKWCSDYYWYNVSPPFKTDGKCNEEKCSLKIAETGHQKDLTA